MSDYVRDAALIDIGCNASCVIVSSDPRVFGTGRICDDDSLIT